MWSTLILAIVSTFQISAVDAAIPDAVQMSYTQTGDFVLGGIFPLSSEGLSACGSVPKVTTLQLMEAMIYCINIVNERDDLLPNVNLGFDIRDDCFADDTALWTALSLINEDQCNYQRLKNVEFRGNLLGIIGPLKSTQSILVGSMCDLMEIPIISYGATSDELSDKSRFEFFSRAVPPDSYQGEALADFLHYMGWEYVSLVYFANTYGIQAAHAFQAFARERDICIAVSAPIRNNPIERELRELADVLYNSKKAKVVVMFVGSATANSIIATLRFIYPDFAARITWIGSDYWSYTMSLKSEKILPMAGIFINFYLPVPTHFKKYFMGLSLNTSINNPWVEMFLRHHTASRIIGRYDSTGLGGLAAAVMDSVLAFAHALDSIIKINCTELSNCNTSFHFTGRDLLENIRYNNFVGTRGPFKMNLKGDLIGHYVLKNLQLVDGEPSLVDIAIWDALNTSQKLTVYPDKIKWVGDVKVKPSSSCREVCKVGYIIVPLKEKCCWGCRKCQSNAIVLNNTACKPCNYTEWPNDDFTLCKTITPNLLELRHPVIAVIVSCSCVGIILCLLTAIELIRYHKHPQIMASSRELSTLNLFGIMLGFVAVFVLLLQPTAQTCSVSHAVISFCLTFTYAPTLLKVSRIYRIFNAGKKFIRRPKWTGPKEQFVLSTALIIIQVIIVVISNVSDPSKPAFLIPSPPDGHLQLYCYYGYGFLPSLIYNVVIVVVCCYYAFRARKVPNNFNESKFIAGSVYSTLILCLAVFPVYLTATDVIQKVAAISAAILINMYLTLACLYLHKLYVIRFLGNEETGDEIPNTAMGARTRAVGPHRNRVCPTVQTINTQD